ncbi:MAG: hypothetical protein ACR2LF_04585 [Jatrophihabitantaceae bacterium]
MDRDDDTPAPDVEFLDVGPQRAPGAGGSVHRWPRWLPLLLLVGLVAATVIAFIVHGNGGPSASPRRSPTPAPPTSSPPSSTALPAASVVVTQMAHPLLGARAGWELFARGDGVVVRIQPARGRITRTTIPVLQSDGPVSFVVGPNLAIVRPIDNVPGYVVPDGHPARQISTGLSHGQGGPVFPGPDPNHIWVQNLGGPPAMALSDLDGARAGPTIPIPPGGSPLDAIPDGAGYLLFPATGGVYDSRPDGLHRITTGALLAVGPTGWLTLDCDARARCVTVVIDRATNARRVVGPAVSDSGGPVGAIAPDGRTAAIFKVGAGNTSTIYLLDLSTGATHRPALSVDQAGYDGTVVWSPDSRWLFAVGADGGLEALDTHTGTVTGLSTVGISVPQLRQLAIRLAPTPTR